MSPHDHCGYCGVRFPDGAGWPRRCGACTRLSFRNPLPVAVLLQPVDDGLLYVRRLLPPVGGLALPGGFVDHGESWQHACARELFEETQLRIDPALVTLFDARSAPDGTLLVFGRAPKLTAGDLPPFTPTNETSERLVFAGQLETAFPLHTAVVRAFWVDGR